MLLKLYGDVKFPKLRIGDEDAKAPMVMCGYFSLNHAANTAKTGYSLIETIRQKKVFYY